MFQDAPKGARILETLPSFLRSHLRVACGEIERNQTQKKKKEVESFSLSLLGWFAELEKDRGSNTKKRREEREEISTNQKIATALFFVIILTSPSVLVARPGGPLAGHGRLF